MQIRFNPSVDLQYKRNLDELKDGWCDVVLLPCGCQV